MTTLQKSLTWLNKLSWIHVFFIGIAFAGGVLLWERYQEQLLVYLPYLFLLLCPLLHLFMCRGHGNHKNGHKKDQD